MRQRQTSLDHGAVAARVYFKGAAELSHPFPHAAEANSCASRRRHGHLLLGWNALSVVLDFQPHASIQTGQCDARARAARVAMNIGKALLHYPEDRELGFLGQAIKVRQYVQPHVDLAALRKSFYVPTKRG